MFFTDNTRLLFRSRNILDDFREAYYWLSQNTPEDARYDRWLFSFIG